MANVQTFENGQSVCLSGRPTQSTTTTTSKLSSLFAASGPGIDLQAVIDLSILQTLTERQIPLIKIDLPVVASEI